MRPIKFRAWDKEQTRMVFGWDNKSVELLAFDGTPYKTEGDKVISLEDIEDNFILMQFTGLLDKNGKEIYDGDIVKLDSWNPSICEVVFNRGGFCFRFSKEDAYYPDGKYLEDGEVIGNVYENPELL